MLELFPVLKKPPFNRTGFGLTFHFSKWSSVNCQSAAIAIISVILIDYFMQTELKL